MPDTTAPSSTTWWTRALPAVVILLAVVYVVLGTLARDFRGDTLNSRLATVSALTSDGTFYVPADDPFLSKTVDKVRVEGRYLSSKPPVLPLLMTGEYLFLRAVAGWSLADSNDVDRLLRVYTLTFVGAPFVLMLMLIARMAAWYIESPWGRAFLVAALGFGTQAGGYATVFNNHVLPAAMITACLYIAIELLGRGARPSAIRMILFGVASSLAVTIDMPSVFLIAPLSLLVLFRYPRAALMITLPVAAIPVLIQTAIYLRYTGSPLPVQVHDSFYLFEDSYWRVPRGTDAMAEPRSVYAFHMTLGRNGLFSLFPVTVLGLAGLFLAMHRSEDAWKRVAVSCALGLVFLTLYYVVSTNNYGGVAFGFRWFIIAAPVLVVLAIPVLARARHALVWCVMAALLAVSIWSTYQCYRHPWSVDREWTAGVFGTRL